MKDLFLEMKEKEYGISPLPENPVIAMAYIPFQNAKKIYNLEQGLCSGTIFPELDKPFDPCCRGEGV
mgnify:CR=1 FL=1